MRLRLAAAALLAASLAGCSEPPYKEMHQAQGALDAARAAGAETYAPTEYKDAKQALDQSQQAVDQRDYRLALRYALDARERAQDAARAAADGKAEARAKAERAVAATENAVRTAAQRIDAARAARLRPRDIAPLVKTRDTADQSLQKARAAMQKEAYVDVQQQLAGVADQVYAAIREIDTREPPRAARRKR